MAFGIAIYPQKKVKLALLDLNSTVEITSLKKTIEYPFPFSQIRIHTFKSSIKQPRTIIAVFPEFFLQSV